jgi:hypothetical protein
VVRAAQGHTCVGGGACVGPPSWWNIHSIWHLWLGSFPNWRWVPLAATLGWFCGRARNQAGSIRAAMVTHTLVVTTWRAFFVA